MSWCLIDTFISIPISVLSQMIRVKMFELFMLGRKSRKVERKRAREHPFLLFYLFLPGSSTARAGYWILPGSRVMVYELD